jgi:aspartate-semialdehyde dehydrogenase
MVELFHDASAGSYTSIFLVAWLVIATQQQLAAVSACTVPAISGTGFSTCTLLASLLQETINTVATSNQEAWIARRQDIPTLSIQFFMVKRFI